MTGRETSLGVVDGRDDAEKLEIIRRREPSGAVQLELRLLAWGEGVGWYAQRTIPLPADARPLLALLRRAERASCHGREAGPRCAVVALPAPAALARPASA